MRNLLRIPKFYFAKRTPLYDFHIANKGKMVEFAGYDMPVQYTKGIIKQSLFCRQKAALFDVSHMGQFQLSGKDRIRLLQRTTVGNTDCHQKDDISECYLTLFLNNEAGIVDDAIVCIDEPNQTIRIVANAGNKYTILNRFIQVSKEQIYDVKINCNENLGLIALQGPMAAQILQKHMERDLSQIAFMSSFRAKINGTSFLFSRSGYTGEDGFEISGDGQKVKQLAQMLVKDENVELAGLGARDALRIQAGLCLHGHEMTQYITPIEAKLMWTIHKRKHTDDRIPFIGQQAFKTRGADNKAGIHKDRKRVGFIVEGPGIIRQEVRLYNHQDQQIGITSSGSYSPTLKKSIGMAYMDPDHIKIGTKAYAQLRGKKHEIVVQKLPFVQPRYYKKWKELYQK